MARIRPDMVGNKFAVGHRPNKTCFKKGQIPWNKGKPNTWYNPKGLKIGRGLFKGKKMPWMEKEKNPNWGKFDKKHPCYKENKNSPFLKQIRATFKYRQWRSDIFTRDNFTCVFCGSRGCELNADHYPKRFIDIINEYKIKTLDEALNCEELWNINNGRTLCIKCHRKTDTWGRQGHSKSPLIEVNTWRQATLRKAKATVND